MLKNGFKNLNGLDVNNALEENIKDRVRFYEESICANLDMPKFKHVHIASVLHHLPTDKLNIVAENIGKLVERGGRLYIYDVNRKSFIGKLYNNHLLKLFPELYKDNEAERPEQE